jgi:hypothetical protein
MGEDSPIRVADLSNLTQASWILTIPSIIYDFVKTNTDAQLLAKPQVRITEGEKAKVRIGDQVPIPVTTFNSADRGRQHRAGDLVPVQGRRHQHRPRAARAPPRDLAQAPIGLAGDGHGLGRRPAGAADHRAARSVDDPVQDSETNFLAG